MKTFKKITLTVLSILLIILLNGCYYVFSGQFKSVKKLNQGKELNAYEKASIYTMHTAVWMLGWPVSPEAAYEAFLLHFPHKKPVVRHIDMYAANGFSTEIKAKGADYANMSFKELRYALALNSENTVFEVTDAYSMCVVPVKYTSAVTKIGPIPVNTVLFEYLQKKNILYPYTIVYYYMYV